MKGHMLVIPKRHVGKISELNKEEREELIKIVLNFQDRILDKFAKGVRYCSELQTFSKGRQFKSSSFTCSFET